MFEHTKAFSVGELYRMEMQRIAANPLLLTIEESIALLSQSDINTSLMSAIFSAHGLTGACGCVAHFLSKSDTEAMICSHAQPIFVSGLRYRRHRDFLAYLDGQSATAWDLMQRRTEIAYRSREWGIWLSMGVKRMRLVAIVARLRWQALAYRCGFEQDPTANLQRLADLFRSGG